MKSTAAAVQYTLFYYWIGIWYNPTLMPNIFQSYNRRISVWYGARYTKWVYQNDECYCQNIGGFTSGNIYSDVWWQVLNYVKVWKRAYQFE